MTRTSPGQGRQMETLAPTPPLRSRGAFLTWRREGNIFPSTRAPSPGDTIVGDLLVISPQQEYRTRGGNKLSEQLELNCLLQPAIKDWTIAKARARFESVNTSSYGRIEVEISVNGQELFRSSSSLGCLLRNSIVGKSSTSSRTTATIHAEKAVCRTRDLVECDCIVKRLSPSLFRR